MLIFVATVYGLVIGSAINAIVWRIYTERKWSKGRSVCPDCKHVLGPSDLVPVLSWLWLRGRCRYCRQRIHWQYPVVELMTAGLFGLSAATLQPVDTFGYVNLSFWLIITVLMIILAVYDLRWMLLPDRVTVPGIVIALGMALVIAIVGGNWSDFWSKLLAALIGGGIFLILSLVADGKLMGGGDFKLVVIMGLVLGGPGLLLALLIAFNSAAIVGIVMIVTKLRRRNEPIPFGPFLVLGTMVSFLYGNHLITWYLRLNGIA